MYRSDATFPPLARKIKQPNPEPKKRTKKNKSKKQMAKNGISLDRLALGLGVTALLASLLRPWEVGYGDNEEGVGVISDTSQGIVPSSKGSQETKVTSSLDARAVGRTVDWSEVANGQKQEGEIQEEKEQEEGNGRSKGADQQDGREDPPANKEETEDTEEGVAAFSRVSGTNLKSTRGQDDSEGDPESTVRRESCSTKGISNRHFPGQ
jgi:hypothetical protein